MAVYWITRAWTPKSDPNEGQTEEYTPQFRTWCLDPDVKQHKCVTEGKLLIKQGDGNNMTSTGATPDEETQFMLCHSTC